VVEATPVTDGPKLKDERPAAGDIEAEGGPCELIEVAAVDERESIPEAAVEDDV
jgi:hypothetical protein